MHAVAVGAKAATTDPLVAQQLACLADVVSAPASLSRESNFEMSDFSRSDSSSANFTPARCRRVLLDKADLRGADLPTALIGDQSRSSDR